MLAPIAWRTPPEHYGPWESITSLLTEGLVARGVDVTLFATLNSVTAAVLDGVCQPFANFSAFGATTNTNLEYDIKVDHNFSEKDKITARWSAHKSKTDQPAAFGPEIGGPLPGTLGPGYSRNPGKPASAGGDADRRTVADRSHLMTCRDSGALRPLVLFGGVCQLVAPGSKNDPPG